MLLATLPFAAAAAAERPDFRAVLRLGDKDLFSLSTPGATRSSWVGVGESFEGWRVQEYLPAEQLLVVEQEGETVRLALAASTITALDVPQAATLEDAEAALRAMKFDEMIRKVLEQQAGSMGQMSRRMVQQSTGEDPGPEFEAFQGRIMKLMTDSMLDPSFRAEVAAAYTEVFTRDELRALTEFYSTKAGAAYVDKQPVLSQRMMAAMQPRMMAVMPEVQRLSQEFAAQQAARRSAPPAGPMPPTPVPAPAPKP